MQLLTTLNGENKISKEQIGIETIYILYMYINELEKFGLSITSVIF